jgi:hypothetical protein
MIAAAPSPMANPNHAPREPVSTIAASMIKAKHNQSTLAQRAFDAAASASAAKIVPIS